MNARRMVFFGSAALLALLPLVGVPEFWITQLNYIGLFAIVALGLVLLTGVSGLTSFGQAAFVGLGAYTSAYLTTAGMMAACQQGCTWLTKMPRWPPAACWPRRSPDA